MLVVAVAVEFVGGFLDDEEAAIEAVLFPVTPEGEAAESTKRCKLAAMPSNEGDDAGRGGNVSMSRRFVFSSLLVVVVVKVIPVEVIRSLVGTVCGSVRCLRTCKTSF